MKAKVLTDRIMSQVRAKLPMLSTVEFHRVYSVVAEVIKDEFEPEPEKPNKILTFPRKK